MNTGTESKKKGTNSTAKVANARVLRSINRLEESMDRLVTHVSQTRDSVEHVKDVVHRPSQWAHRGLDQVKREPALYFAIAWGLGLVYWTSTRLAKQHRVTRSRPTVKPEEIFIVKKSAKRHRSRAH